VNTQAVKNILESACLTGGLPFSGEKLVGYPQSFVNLIYRLIRELNIKCMLEWGPGFSTMVELMASKDLLLYSYEDKEKWTTEYKKEFESKFPELAPRLNFTLETDMDKYVKTTFSDEFFDMILVDGVERQRCLDRAYDLLKPGGILLLHDAHQGKASMTRDMIFIGTHTFNGQGEWTNVWLKRKGKD
jgi:predicted O-methyltransferase YrrM